MGEVQGGSRQDRGLGQGVRVIWLCPHPTPTFSPTILFFSGVLDFTFWGSAAGLRLIQGPAAAIDKSCNFLNAQAVVVSGPQSHIHPKTPLTSSTMPW